MTTPALLVDGNMEDEKSLLVQKANAFDLISDFTAGTPFLSEIAYVSRPAFPTASTEAKAMNTNSSLIHRALGDHPHLLETIVSSKASHNPKPHSLITAQLSEANTVLNNLVTANSAHVRKTNYCIIGLYRKYLSTLNSNLPPLSEDYFRKLVHELHIVFNVESQSCSLCDLYNSTNFGSSLSSEQYGICVSHFRTKMLQVDAYYNFMEELKNGKFGKLMFGRIYSGSLIVFDFGQLDPSTKRHKDGQLHFWLCSGDGRTLKSLPIHYIGDDSSDQPASVGFVVGCLRHASLLEEIKNLELLVFFTDGGVKEFNSDLISLLPILEKELNKKISWNYWASNHGAGVSDTDQQNARSTLKAELPERKTINDSSTMVNIINEKQLGALAVDASSFPRQLEISPPTLPNTNGISQYHCFNVEDNYVIGFENSYNLSKRRNFSLPFKILSKQQQFFKERFEAGLGAFFCESCDWYYVDKHKCKLDKDLSDEKTSNKVKEEKKMKKHKKKKKKNKNKKKKKMNEVENVQEQEKLLKRTLDEELNMKLGKRVKVWFRSGNSEKGYTTIGEVIEEDGNNCTIQWDNRKKPEKNIILEEKNRTNDKNNDERWDYVD